MLSSLTAGTVVRACATVVYLVGTGIWMLYMGLLSALRCDDNCLAPQYVNSWRETTDAWQWSAVGWLGFVGAGLALIAVVGSWFGRTIGLALFSTHLAVLAANLFILLHGADWGDTSGVTLGIALVGVAGFVAVAGWRPKRAGRDVPAASLEP